ncbi:DMT family transporter [Kitasatospora sp. NPDC092286]|uniref:DMT family transporter n=1 Tax=Kitasatospora sp. NPDC092286 TaxID=3364087 RepID=UPI003812BC20
MTAYLLVGAAIVAEVTATLALRASHGLTKVLPSVVVGIGYVIAFVLLAQALKSLNVGPVYAVWSGLGTVGALVGGVVAFGEPVKPASVAGAVLVVAGVAVLYLGGGMSHE